MSSARIVRCGTTVALAVVLVLSVVSLAFATDGTFLREWSTGAGSRPVALDVDPAGNVYVAQIGTGFNRVEKFSSTGASLLTWGSGVMVSPRGVAVDPAGTSVYVVDYGTNATNGQYVRKYDTSGNLIATWSGFGRPDGVAVDAAGNVYVVERGAAQIRKLDSSGNILATWNLGTGVDLNNPIDAAVDSAGNVYVTDRGNNRVQKLDSSGNVVATWAGFTAPDGIEVDSTGNVYVAEYQLDRVRKFDSNGTQLFALTVADGRWATGDGPRGLAVDQADDLYVALLEGHKVAVFGTAAPPPPVYTTPASSTWSVLILVFAAFGVLYLGHARRAQHTQ